MKETFNSVAELYDRARPSYPKELLSFVSETIDLNGEEHILEIGPGTGQATKQFIERGHYISAIELGWDLAEVLKRNCPENLEVIIGDFDELAPKLNLRVPMVYCATAFHWLNPTTRYRDCSNLLTDDGHLVLIWNGKSGDTHPVIKEAYEFLYSFHGKAFDDANDYVSLWKEDIARSQYFELKAFKEVIWNPNETLEQFKENFYSQSSYLSLCESNKKLVQERNEALFRDLTEDDLGEISTTVYICSKKAND